MVSEPAHLSEQRLHALSCVAYALLHSAVNDRCTQARSEWLTGWCSLCCAVHLPDCLHADASDGTTRAFCKSCWCSTYDAYAKILADAKKNFTANDEFYYSSCIHRLLVEARAAGKLSKASVKAAGECSGLEMMTQCSPEQGTPFYEAKYAAAKQMLADRNGTCPLAAAEYSKSDDFKAAVKDGCGGESCQGSGL